MQVTAKIDYALRALVELASTPGGRATRAELAAAQQIPPRYLEAILLQLRQAGLVVGRRGSTAGGYSLARPAEEISIAEISRAVDGPLAIIQGVRPEQAVYEGAAEHLGQLWIGMRAALRSVMETVTLAELVTGEFPPSVQTLVDDPESWLPRL